MAWNHGTCYAYQKAGCRCDICRAGNTQRAAVMRANRAARGRDNPDLIPHGYGGFSNWECRCDVCRAAFNEWQVIYTRKRNRRLVLGVAVNHGKVSTYTNYGCRCEACSAALRVSRRSYIQNLRIKAKAYDGLIDLGIAAQEGGTGG